MMDNPEESNPSDNLLFFQLIIVKTRANKGITQAIAHPTL